MKGLIFGGAYIRRKICVSKSIELAYIWKEIYVSNLRLVFTETRLEDVDLSKKLSHASSLFVWAEEIQAKTEE